MKRPRLLLIVMALNLLGVLALAFAYPHLMVSPGPLVKGHAELAADCFACHAAWRGAASGRCQSCHALADVGLRTTKGVAIAKATIRGSFHQELVEQDCMACHSDHQGPRLTQRSRKPFSHGLLRVAVRDTCSACHAAPQDTVHRDLRIECSRCHESRAWKPATFDHDKYFVLDRDHQTACDTCHRNSDFKRYTCYGCHEHSQAKVRAQHEEEGIRNFENCTECHRDPRVEPDRRGGRDRSRKHRD